MLGELDLGPVLAVAVMHALAFGVVWVATGGGHLGTIRPLQTSRSIGTVVAALPLLATLVCLVPSAPRSPDGLGGLWVFVFGACSFPLAWLVLIGLAIQATLLKGRPPEDDDVP